MSTRRVSGYRNTRAPARERTRRAPRMACVASVALLGSISACGHSSPEREPTAEAATAEAAAAPPRIELLATDDVTPPGGDGAPRLTLAFRLADGTRIPIADRATSYVPFRDGAALVDLEGRLLLVSPDGARRVLAREAGAPPALGERGELAYVARQDLEAEVHVLEAGGRDRIVATGLASAGVLAPQPDGRLLFVGARRGGVAGLWLAGDGAARCLTNCELETGAPLGARFVPLPESAEAIRVHGERVEWKASDGSLRSAPLERAGAPAEPPELPELEREPVGESPVRGAP